MSTSPASGPGGSSGPASGSYLPVADTTDATLDSTTYNNSVTGSGKLRVLVARGSETVAAAVTRQGEAFPEWLLTSSGTDLLYAGDSVTDPYGNGAFLGVDTSIGTPYGWQASPIDLFTNPSKASHAARLKDLSPRFTVTSGALPTLVIVSGTGRQVSTTRDAETVTPFTADGTNNAATCLVELSPDDVTYSALATISIAAALNNLGALVEAVKVRVPAGWYLKLTAVHGALGTLTYY